MFGFGARKKAQDTCSALRNHIVSVIKQVSDNGADSLLGINDLNANKNGSHILWWVGAFQAGCSDSHRENVQQIMLDGGGEFNGITIYAYTDSIDPSTWKMQLDSNSQGKPTKLARLMYETFAKFYGVQDLRAYLK